MRGIEKPGSMWAEVAGILFLLLLPLVLINSGYTWAAFQDFETDKVLAEAMHLNGEGTSAMMGAIWSLGILLLGSALVLQKRFHVAIGYFAMVLVALIFISEITEDLVPVLGIGWFALPILSVVMGILSIIGKERQSQS